jgi:hypothetical protein
MENPGLRRDFLFSHKRQQSLLPSGDATGFLCVFISVTSELFMLKVWGL